MSKEPARRPKGQRPKSQKQVNSQAPKPVSLPVAPRTAWRLIAGSLGALGLAGIITWGLAARLPEKALMGLATSASEAGFTVRQVDIQGVTHQPKLDIYREVLTGGTDSMMLTDLPAARARLQELPWVKDVSLARRWPDRLEIRVEERKPAALWQANGRMRLIDTEGVVLPVANINDFANLPMVVGKDANIQAPELLQILAGQPEVSEQMRAALWVGQRRWDIRMRTGETISLPEGPKAQAALMQFAEVHRDTPLLGRGFVRFDLRIPDKMVVRVAGEPGAPVKPRPEPKPEPQAAPTQQNQTYQGGASQAGAGTPPVAQRASGNGQVTYNRTTVAEVVI